MNNPLDLTLTLYAGVLIFVYFIPSFFAFALRHPHRWLILLFNLAFAGTLIGWFIALIWSFRKTIS